MNCEEESMKSSLEEGPSKLIGSITSGREEEKGKSVKKKKKHKSPKPDTTSGRQSPDFSLLEITKVLKSYENKDDLTIHLLPADEIGNDDEGTPRASGDLGGTVKKKRARKKKKTSESKRTDKTGSPPELDSVGEVEQLQMNNVKIIKNNRTMHRSQKVNTSNNPSEGGGGGTPVDRISRRMCKMKLNPPPQKATTPKTKAAAAQPQKNETPKSAKKKEEEFFEQYVPLELVEIGLESGNYIQGEIRINVKNFKEAFISDPENGQDIFIEGVAARNRALEGDVVAIVINPKDKWLKQENGTMRRTGKVVYIMDVVHSRICVGFLKNLEKNYALFCPKDHRLPRIQIPVTTIPMAILQNQEKYRDTLFSARIVTWMIPSLAQGVLLDEIGEKGDIKAETNGILIQLGLHTEQVPEVLHRYLPEIPYTISQEEIDSRLDLRTTCIFSIDPDTARDLDDAVSIEKLGEDDFRVGVHISDVSHFLQEGTPLDEIVGKRATTVYMVQSALHMLPSQLCMLCSLLPGQDKLAISIVWRMDSEGNMKDQPKICRSVINSCCQLSYNHAQSVIDNRPTEFPPIYNGVTEEEVRESILNLNKIALVMRKTRFDNGALSINQPKAWFRLDEDCLPLDVSLYEIKDAHRLIEEYMLLANTCVAEHLHRSNPKISLLRRHNPPKLEMLYKLEQMFHKLGIFLDIDSSAGLSESIKSSAGDDFARLSVLNLYLSKPMCRAEYYCHSDDSHHYALNVELYTHFTSPIRRYADIVVHRVLTATLGYNECPSWSTDQVRGFANNCNKKKFAAKKAGEMSAEFFTALYVKKLGFYKTRGIVCAVLSYSFEVIIVDLALNLRVYVQDIDGQFEFTEDGCASSLIIRWNRHRPQVIQVFSVVDLLLKPITDYTQVKGELLPPAD